MIRTSLMAFCLAICLAGCAGDPAAPVASSEPAEPATTTAPQTPPQQSSIPGAQRFHATDLRPGDCIEPLPQTFMATVVPCKVPHSAEFAATYVLPEGPYPGTDMRRLMENGCPPRMRIKGPKRDVVGLWGLIPSLEDWPRYRTMYCMVVPLDGKKMTGRVIE